MGSALQTIEIAADGSLSCARPGWDWCIWARTPCDQQLITLRQLSRSLPDELRRRSGTSLDLSDPSKPELQMPIQPKADTTPPAKTSER